MSWHKLKDGIMPKVGASVNICTISRGKQHYHTAIYDGYWFHVPGNSIIRYYDKKSIVAWADIDPYEVEE